MTIVPQWDFLDFLAAEASRTVHFRLVMEARADGLVVEDGVVRGVRYRTPDGEQELRAHLTVAADGRRSHMRELAGLRRRDLGSPLDVLWFRLPREVGDTEETFLRAGPGRSLAVINRGHYWQISYVIAKGGFDRLQVDGIGAFSRSVGELLPFLAGRVGELRSFADIETLSVTVDRLPRWFRAGMLVIGDAAHAMSPIGGVGINLAIQDAVATANTLAGTLLNRQGSCAARPVPLRLLARIQLRRYVPTAVVQALQVALQKRIARKVADGTEPGNVVRSERMPEFAKHLGGRLIGLGLLPERVRLPRSAPGYRE